MPLIEYFLLVQDVIRIILAFSFYIPLVSLNLGWFFSLSLSFMTLIFLESIVDWFYVYQCGLVWFFFFFFFCLFRAALMAYGCSQPRGWIGAVATGLHYSHSNVGSEPHLQHPIAYNSCQHWIFNPLIRARGQTCILMDTGQICFLWATMEIPVWCFFQD